MIVIDVGCARYGGDFSIERLIAEFSPEVLYGFDPNPTVRYPDHVNGAHVLISRSAAWTEDGEVGFLEDGLNSCLTYSEDAPKVPCFDLARFISELPEDEIVLKIDAEGSEYDLLPHLMLQCADELLHLAIVEWHERGIERAKERRRVIEKTINCELREWRW